MISTIGGDIYEQGKRIAEKRYHGNSKAFWGFVTGYLDGATAAIGSNNDYIRINSRYKPVKPITGLRLYHKNKRPVYIELDHPVVLSLTGALMSKTIEKIIGIDKVALLSNKVRKFGRTHKKYYVIDTYPNSPFKVGTVLEKAKTAGIGVLSPFGNNEVTITEDEVLKHPHIFKEIKICQEQ